MDLILSSRLGLFSASLFLLVGCKNPWKFGLINFNQMFRQVLRFQGSGFSSKVSVFDEFRRVRFCSRGLDGTGSGNRVLGTRGIKKVPGSGDSVAKVPKVAFVN